MTALFRKQPGYLVGLLAGLYSYTLLYFNSYTYIILLGSIAISLALLLAFTDYSFFYKLLFLTLPVALETAIGNGDNKIILPSEALIIVLALVFGIKNFFRQGIKRNILHHPVSLFILAWMTVMAVTILPSGMPVVSVKFTLVNISYVLVFYFLAMDFFEKKEANMKMVFFLYALPMIFVVLRALYYHSTTGFHHELSGLVVHPYFKDHTIYSACLSMLLPVFVGFALRGKVFGISTAGIAFSGAVVIILITAIFFSFSRAAWLSIGAAAVFYIILLLRVKPSHLFAVLAVAVITVWIFRDDVVLRMKTNLYTSTEKNVGLAEQTRSITNIRSDASNAERVNRWSCAYRMFLDKPLMGFGPGTYQFEYLPYQLPEEMTRISVKSAYYNTYGRGGSAHSEYLLVLSESGLFGFLAVLGLIVSVIYTGMRTYYRAKNQIIKYFTAMALVGFVTYATHGVFNNFLNDNKPAGLFWMLIAVIVLLDIKKGKSIEASRPN